MFRHLFENAHRTDTTMMERPCVSAGNPPGSSLPRIAGIFWGILGAAVALALMILFLPDQIYLALSNYLQIITAFLGAAVLLYSWHHYGRQEHLLYAGGALGLWGLSNIAWYGYVLLGRRTAAFPSLIDLGLIASIFILAIAIRKGFPEKPAPAWLFPAVIVLSLIIPAGVIVTQGVGIAAVVTLLYFLACGLLAATGISRSIEGFPVLLSGTLLFALAFMIYPLREMFFIQNPMLAVIGTFVFGGFALLVIGLLPGDRESKDQ
jgi:uncharacterized membrane protein YeaQ/YmgE (transglycosylase-associated protein family)